MSSAKDVTARKNEQLLVELLKQEANKQCADCGQKGTRWASWNLGVFLCIRCGGLHRKLGTHISRVKSVNLDKWTDEQVENMVNNGNAKVNALYNPHPERFPFPTFAGDMEQYIRDKYERRLFMSPEGRGMAAVRQATAHPPAAAFATAANSKGNDLSSASAGGRTEARYPLQMRSLQDMGFADASANQAALLSSSGNLQQAVEALLAGKFRSVGLREEEPRKSSTPADDLASVFGTLPSTATAATGNTSGSLKAQTSDSILDMDFPPPPSAAAPHVEQEAVADDREGSGPHHVPSDEFEEFEEFASAPTPSVASGDHFEDEDPLGLSSTLTEPQKPALNGKGKPASLSAQPKSLPSIDPALGNPWASNNGGSTGDAFDDIDPFRGFNRQ